MTESIGNLIAALAKAQAKFEPPKKNKVAKVKSQTGASYEYRYSDLADLIAAVRGPLAENELAFTHRLVPAERGTIVSTILAHSSGEMLTSDYLVPNFQKQQEFGSALTYAKRYALSGLLGIAADDDDDGSIADDAGDRPRPQINGKVNGASLPPNPEEPPEIGEDRKRIRALIDRLAERIKTAPDEHRLEVIMDDARDGDLKEIEASGPGGIDAGKTLRARYATKIALLRNAAA